MKFNNLYNLLFEYSTVSKKTLNDEFTDLNQQFIDDILPPLEQLSNKN